jgi:hypothetical protein
MSTIEIGKDLGQGIYTKQEVDTGLSANTSAVDAMITNVAGETIVQQDMIPENNMVALGSLEKPFRDVFISESSLYVNGQKVLSEESGTINISADDNQNVRISTGGVGDIEFLPVGTGSIELKGNVSITAGKKILSSDGNAIVIDEDLNVQVITSPTITLLDGRIQSLETLTTSDDMNLDTLQEVVDFIKANRADLDSLNLDWSSITNKPTTFPPEAHDHNNSYHTKLEMGDATDFNTAFDAAIA